MSNEHVLKKASLADLIFRAIFIIFSILTVGITIHTYQLSINTINEEVKRNLQQTSSLITNYLNHRLSTLQIRQDTDAGSLGIQNNDSKDHIKSLENYFSDIEERSPHNSPDFRFIEVDNSLYWDDGNSLFFGLEDNDFQRIVKKNIHINAWYYMMIDQSVSQVHFLIRKTPIVVSSTGKMRGYLYNAVILNNNVSFLNDLKEISNSQDILIANNGKIITSSIGKEREEYKEIQIALTNPECKLTNKILNVTELDIKSLNGSLSIASLKNRDNIDLLEQNFIYSVVLSFLILIALAVIIRGLFEHKILLALNSLLDYANNVSKNEASTEYKGSGIVEFDHIGHKLECIFIELIEAKKESYKAQAVAEKSTQVKSDFLARMSHEIRTPLNGILGISSLLRQSDLTIEQKKQMMILHQGGEHLLAVLNDVLDFSQIEQDKLNINCEPFALSEVLETIKAIYTPICNEKGIEFLINNNINSAVLINTDQVRITQILFNLLSNAVKFTENGYVALTLSLKFQDSQAVLHIDVKDTGIGIAQNKQVLMFEPFIQVESSEIRKVGGSGLGLAIIRQLLNLLYGSIRVESQIGAGSVFYIQVPVTVIDASVLTRNIKHNNHDSLLPANLNVLLIEDNKSNAYIAKAYCQKYNLKVTWETSAKEGIGRLLESSFDLILMDNQMPGISGIEATKYIRQELKLSTPIYAYTADVLKEAHDEFLSVGANYIITKPIKEKSILDALVFYKSELRS